MKQLTNAYYEVCKFDFFCLGVREEKKVGKRWSTVFHQRVIFVNSNVNIET